jgi:hypothetical protein
MVENKINWKVGDKCLYDFEEGEILETDNDGNVHQVRHSCFVISGNLTDRCFPLTEKGHEISDFFAEQYRRLHNTVPAQANFPDFNRYAVGKWCEAMKDFNAADAICQDFREWCARVIATFNSIKLIYINGVRMMI